MDSAPLPKPDVILTHESDLDGLLSGLLLQRLARKLFSTEVRLEAWNYNGWRNRAMTESAAWVCDLTFDARLDRTNWVVIDHHVTDVQPRSARLIHNTTKSAGLLCYELCLEHGLGSPKLDRLVELSNVADLFLEDHPDFVVATDHANLVKEYSFWNLHALVGGELEALLDHPLLEIMALKRRVEDPIGLAWSRRHVTALSPEVGYVETVVGNTNYIVHQLLETGATPHRVLLTAFQKTNGQVILSLRSRDGGALKVAEKLKGGGHANAAGATLPRAVQSIPDALDYLRKILNPGPAPAGDGGLNSLEQLFAGVRVAK